MKFKSIYLAALVLIIFCIFTFFNTFERIENTLQDSIFQSPGKADSRIVILGIDDPSLDKLKQWPWPRNYIADAINILSKGKAAAVGVDIIYAEDARNPEEDTALVNAVKNAGNVVIPVYGEFGNKYIKANEMKTEVLKQPFQKLREAAVTGHINALPDQSDGIVRRNLVSFTYFNTDINSFAGEIYKLYIKNIGKTPEKIVIPRDAFNRAYISFAEEPFRFEHHSIYKVLNGEIPPEYFQDKIVLIGPYTVGINDFFPTAIDHQTSMYGVEIHANIIQNYLYKNFKQYVPEWISLILILLLSAAGFFTFRKLSPAKSAIITGAFIVIYTIASKIAYGKGFIMTLLYPMALVVVLYLIMLAYRYIEEYLERRRITGVFGRYVAPQIVDQILKGGEESLKLGGTRREITALFVDIRGFTPMSEKVQPEQVVEILNDYLNLTASSIFKFGGTLDKFIGDATMAIFNAPLDLEDHAFKAVQTAWAMKEGSAVLQKGLEEKFGRSVQFGIGINTGYAVVGNIGAKFRMDYTAIGDTVNTAARLESTAKPGQILMSQATYELVKGRVEAAYLGEIKVKGKEQGVPVYQLNGIGNTDAIENTNDEIIDKQPEEKDKVTL